MERRQKDTSMIVPPTASGTSQGDPHHRGSYKAILADTAQYEGDELSGQYLQRRHHLLQPLHRWLPRCQTTAVPRYDQGCLVHQDINLLRALNTKYYIIPDKLPAEKR